MVPAAGRRVDLAAHLGDVDECPAALVAHVGQDELDEPGRAEDVDLELIAGLGQRARPNGPVRALAGGVDQDIDAALLGEDVPDAGLHGLVVGDIHGEGADTRVGEALHALQPPGCGVGGVAEFMQLQGGGFADTGRASGDEGDFGGHGRDFHPARMMPRRSARDEIGVWRRRPLHWSGLR